MRLAFFGTPDIAVFPLWALVSVGHQVEVVVTRADKKRGRGGALVPSPVKAAAVDLGLTVSQDPEAVLGRNLDLGVVVAFGRIIKPHVLAELPMVNVHFSLLPRWRGAAPVERAVLAGDNTTGVCLMEVAEGLDEGGVYAVEETAIEPTETVGDLRERLMGMGSRLLVDGLAVGLGSATPQTGEVTYAAKIEPHERRLDWSEPAEMCMRRIRVGRAWTTFHGRRLLVHRARPTREPADHGRETLAGRLRLEEGVVVDCGDGATLELLEVQPEGKPAMDAQAWVRGARVAADGDRLGP